MRLGIAHGTLNGMRAAYRPLVLVVDDGRQHVTLLRLALMQRGYAVVVVHSQEGACTMVRERSVDAVLVTLPLDAGLDVLRAFGEAKPAVSVAVAPTEDLPRALASGFDLALTRPIDFAELDTILRERMKMRSSGTRTRARVSPEERRAKRKVTKIA